MKWIVYAKVSVFALSLLPLVFLVVGLFTHQLGPNPIETLTRSSGDWALRFLLLTLCLTPLRWLTGWSHWLRFRRMLGLFTFFYACQHMLLYLGLDQFFDVTEIWLDIVKRPFITIGFICFVLLLPLAITSSNKMVKRLGGKAWQSLHQLVYPIAILGCLHFFMLTKADFREPIIYSVILFGLLSFRLVKRLI